jgi:hypothetical protein
MRGCFSEQDAEENNRTSVGGDNRSLEKICMIRSFMICICLLIKKLSDQTKDDELSEASGTQCTDEKCILIMLGKYEGKRPLGRPRHGRENHTEIDVQGIEWEGTDWIHMW